MKHKSPYAAVNPKRAKCRGGESDPAVKRENNSGENTKYRNVLHFSLVEPLSELPFKLSPLLICLRNRFAEVAHGLLLLNIVTESSLLKVNMVSEL